MRRPPRPSSAVSRAPQRALRSCLHAHGLACALAVAAVATGCGDDARRSTPDAEVPSASELATEALHSINACRTDIDCAGDLFCFQGRCVHECEGADDCSDDDTCSPRRQCLKGEQDGVGTAANAATPEVIPGVGIALPPYENQSIKPGQDKVTLKFTTSAPVPGGFVGYTVETYSLATHTSVAADQLFRTEGTDSFEIVIPTGSADPASNTPGIVQVLVSSSVGTFRVTLSPEATVTGRYAGTVKVPRFGSSGLPIDLELLTDPVDATLETAAHVYAVLPIRSGSIFAPTAVDQAGPGAATVELAYQDATSTWTGRTRSTFAFPEGSMMSRFAAGSVTRGLRIDISLDQGLLTGTLRDSWEGLYDARTAAGVASPATVVFEGQLEARRVASARALSDLPEQPEQANTRAQLQALPDVSACTASQFAVADLTVAGQAATCTGVGSAAAFAAAEPAEQSACALAVAETALQAGNTTAATITAFLSGNTDVTGAESFADFMKRCAAGEDGACRPSAAVLCGRALTSHALLAQASPTASYRAVYDAYVRTTREAFLGRQLGAYQADADTRLEWLQSQSYPAIVTAAVQGLNEDLIAKWKSSVLDSHFGAVSGQFDGAGLAVLAREAEDEDSIEGRRLLLSEMTQSWRGAMDALALASRRWNDVYQGSTERAESASFVANSAFDLYVLGGLIDQLNSSAGSGFASSALAAGFGSLLIELRQLSLPFSALVFARDAEVVVSNSLDPLSTGDSVLSEISEAAMAELDRATTSVQAIVARAKQMAVDEKLLRNDLANQVNSAFDELVTLCGFPEGCGPKTREKPECWPRVSAGECGFGTQVTNTGTAERPLLDVEVIDFTSSSNISDAGDAILQVMQAEAEREGNRSALKAYKDSTTRMVDSYSELKQTVEKRIERARENRAAIDEKFAEIATMQDSSFDGINAYYESLTASRDAAYAARSSSIAELAMVRSDGRNEDLRQMRDATSLRQSASSLRAASGRIDKLAELGSDSTPTALDDVGAPVRLAINMASYGVTAAMDVVAEGFDIGATVVEYNREAAAQLNANNLAQKEQLGDLQMQKFENELAALEEENARQGERDAIDEQRKRDAIDLLRGQLDIDTQIERDSETLVERRDALLDRIVSETERNNQVVQSDLTVQQLQSSYLRIVQRAQLLDGRLRNLVAQRDQVNLNLGSPSVVFGWANQLTQAESRLERTKSKMMDWVVALEYLAVRPFMDARLQIMLARNTYQLSELAGALADIQSRCGGAVNTNSAVISLRDDVMMLDSNVLDEASGELLSPADTFRDILQRGSIPVDKRIRISGDSSVGALVSRGGILASSFDLSLSNFANLASSCNAKVKDISVKLVGEGLGRARPTVAVIYNGDSAVRSCQPDVGKIVEQIGAGATTFGEVTVFKAAGRVLSPVAGVNEFGTENQTLVGLPLASQYTVVIDPTSGENASIDWSKLEDIELQFNYGYQDFFPVGQCR